MRVKAFLLLCFVALVLVGCGGGGGSDSDSVANKIFSMPTEKNSADFLENDNIDYGVTYYKFSTNEKLDSGNGTIWGKSYPEQIDGVERNVTEILMDLIINGTSQTFYEKNYIITDGASWYKHDYETKAVIGERLYSSVEALEGELDYLPETAIVGDFGDLPDYQIIDDSYSSDVVKRVENSWRIMEKDGNLGVVVMSTGYNRYKDRIQYDDVILTINEYGEVLELEMNRIDYRDDMKMVMTMRR